MSIPASSLLKLRARDGEDVQVISAVLQDAIAPVCDMAFQTETKSFVMVVQRLMREVGHAGAPERICSALTVSGVRAVRTQGIDLHQSDRMLDLLAILLDPATADAPQNISLVFAGNAKIKFDVTDWTATLEDFGAPWPALCNPCHDSTPLAS